MFRGREVEARETSRGDVFWIREWRSGGEVHFRIGRSGEDLVAEWVGVAELRAGRSGDPVSLVLATDVNEAQVNKIRIGAAQALVRHLQGRLSLHASSVVRGGRAILLLGDADCGKSTTAAKLCFSHGFALLADDIAFLDESAAGFSVVPSEAVHWLCADAAGYFGASQGDHLKTALPAKQPATSTAALSVTVKLVFDERIRHPTASRLGGESAFLALGRGMMRFALDDRDVDLRDLELLAKMYSAAPMYELRRRRSLEALTDTIEVLLALADLGEGGTEPRGAGGGC